MPPTPGQENQPNDLELDELEKLLLAAEEIEKDLPKKDSNLVPKLREDDSFAKEIGGYNFSNGETNPSIQQNTNSTTNKQVEEEFDSSDDEQVKNFLEQKYNEYGRDINKKLKQIHEENRDKKITTEVNININNTKNNEQNFNHISQPPKNLPKENHSFPWQKLPNSNSMAASNRLPIKISENQTNVYTDPIFGLRFVNPLVSSAILTERMSGRTPISMSGVAFHTERGDLSKDWVIAGVIISKSPIKTTKKGSSYSIWKLSDLKGDIKMLSLFLFKNAHKELWKTAVGTVVAVLNPGVFEKREERNDVACLSIDNPLKVMILGQSKDLGKCKSTKKNGEPCGAIINLNDCDFCIYHIKSEFGRMSRRAELQSSTAGRGLHELRNKILGKSEVFYGGQSFTAIPARKSVKQIAKDDKRLMTLSEYYQSPNAGNVNHISKPREIKNIPYAPRNGPISKVAAVVEINTKQRLKDLERLKCLKATEEESTQSKNVISLEVPEKFQNKEFSFSQKTPILSKDTFSIDLNLNSRKATLSKQKALQIIQKKPLEKSNPNFIKYRGTSEGKKRAIDELDSMDNTTKKRRLEDQQDEEKKTRIQKMIEATSSHTNLIKSRDNEEQEKYFNKLEKKEALEEKMLSTYKVPCKAVICSKCKYTAFSAADRCKEEKHPLKVIDTEKRFFQCEDCGNRTVTVHKMPKLTCKNCKSSRWKRSAMIREKKTYDPTENLCIRGDEEKYLGGLKANSANLNLLVPE